MLNRPWLSFGLALAAFACHRSQSTTAPSTAALVSSVSQAASSSKQPAATAVATLIVTTGTAPFARSVVRASPTQVDSNVIVRRSNLLQSITGFGGAFNEKGWEALLTLSPAERDEVIKALFDPVSGLRFNRARAPVGASDYAVDRYTLDETPGDLEMRKFSIERDRLRLIPYIRAALQVRPDLEIWASAWTPPSWMKTNRAFDGGAFKDEPKMYAAYALYLAKYVDSYRQEGIKVFMVVPQNEPGQLTHYPSCDWKPSQYVTFIRDYLGPTFRERNEAAAIFVGTINRGDWDVMAVLDDAPTLAQIAGVAVQWDGIRHVVGIRRAFPQLEIMQSETECGNNHWQAGYNPTQAPNNFSYAVHTWRKFRDFMTAGASSYFLWNMVLDEQGKNIDSLAPWPQNSAVVINRSTRQVAYTPMFYATKHFSGLVDIGSHLVQTEGDYADRIAFVNPDGSAVVELLNTSTRQTRVSVAVDARAFVLDLPAESFATLLVAPG